LIIRTQGWSGGRGAGTVGGGATLGGGGGWKTGHGCCQGTGG